MKNFQILLIFSSLLALGIFNSCDSDNDTDATGSLEIEIASFLEATNLILEDQTYDHGPGGTFVVEDFKFYISNIRLTNADTKEIYKVENTYFLVHKDNNYVDYTITLEDIPVGNYENILFMLGIDPERNTSIDNIGDLDPNNQMAWNWNIGYKFLLFEGTFTSETGEEKPLVFHIGGDDNLRDNLVSFIDEVKIRKSGIAKIYMKSDVADLFENPNTIDFNTSNTIKHSPEASEIAENYAFFLTTYQPQ